MSDERDPASRDFAEQLQQLREDVDLLLLLTRPDATQRSAGPDTSWQAMPAARAADAWTALIEWVDALVDRYALDETIPACWYAHGAMVEELHALHAAWLAAYTGRTAQSPDRAVWHELLARTITRVHEWDRHGCAGGIHRPDEPLELTREQRTMRTASVHADLQARTRRDSANIAG